MPMRFREWLGLQKEMVQEVSGILSIALLTLNVGLSAFLLVKDTTTFGAASRDIGFVVPLIVLTLALVVWTLAYAWHFLGRMHFAKQRALATLNPYMTTDFNPHEWVIWKHVSLPQLRAQRDTLAKVGADTKELDACIARVEAWLEQGTIPKADFPPMLQRFLRAS
ncbi:MAG: hypothetical protein LC624_12395 [Halobacteriales archaeon]|nr:hypothetical protein [Halobacteriales archaeon]